MKYIGYLAGGSILTAVVLSIVSGLASLEIEREIWFGMLAPTLASVLAWMASVRQRHPDSRMILKRLTQAFVVKFLFFGVYIVVLVKTGQVRPEPFIGCFALFYVALHMTEALRLRRMQVKPPHGGSG